MKKIKLMLKGMLLYATTFLIIVFVSGIDSIMEQGFSWFFTCLIVCAIYVAFCYLLISEEEFKTLTLYKYLSKLDKEEED